jgi:hypothetical protein
MNEPTDPIAPLEPEATPENKGLHRHKKQRSSHKRESTFWARYQWETSLFLILLLGVVFLINPWPSLISDTVTNPTTWQNMMRYLAYGGGSTLLGGLFFMSAVPVSVLYIRQGVIYNQRFWRRNGCPRCGRDDLRRTSRIWRDKLLNRLGIPIRRYICADCRWEGARIDEAHI